MGIFTFDRSGQITGFEEKPNAERLAQMKTERARWLDVCSPTTDDRPFIASMGIYLFSRTVLLEMLEQERATISGGS